MIAYGPGGIALVKIVTEPIPPIEQRTTARHVLAKYPDRPTERQHYPDDMPYGEVTRFKHDDYLRWKEWADEKDRLERMAYPYHYFVGYDTNNRAMLLAQFQEGITWEDALAKAHILVDTKRLPAFMR